MRFVILSLEFDAGTFSGNGMYSMAQVWAPAAAAALCTAGNTSSLPKAAPSLMTMPLQARALTQLGHDVLVVAGAPPGYSEPSAGTAVEGVAALARQTFHVRAHSLPACTPPACLPLPLLASPAPLIDIHLHTPILAQVPLPSWGLLDASCAWREFATGAAQPHVAEAVAAARPHAVLGVDWHSVGAYDSLVAAAAASGRDVGCTSWPPPFVYLNYR